MKYSLSVFTVFRRFLFSRRANAVIRRVSFICLLGLVVSIGSLVVVFNIMGGLGQSIKDSFLKSEPHIIISFNNKFSNSFVKKQKHKIKNLLQSAHLSEGVENFYFFETVDLVLRTDSGSFSGAIARGYDKKNLEMILKNIPTIRSEPNSEKNVLDHVDIGEESEGLYAQKSIGQDKESSLKTPKIAMSWNVANELGVYEGEELSLIPAENLLLPPGEPVQFEWARLEQVILPQDQPGDIGSVFYDRKYFSAFAGSSSYTYGFEMYLSQPDQYFLYQDVLEANGFSIQAWPDRNSAVFFALKVEKIIMSCFLSLAGLITLMAVSSLLVLLMLQKKKEMGILMAMGLPLQQIKGIFIGVGFLLCGLGSLGGWLMALLICLALKYIPLPFLSQFHGGFLFPVEFNWYFLTIILVSAFVLAFFSCWISVWSQTKESPSELLKTTKA